MPKPTRPPYQPEPGSLPARVLALFARQPDEHFTSGDLALKFVVQAAKFKAALQPAVAAQLLAYSKVDEDGPSVWHTTPQFAAWLAKTAPATPAAEPAAKTAQRPRRGGTRTHLPALDVASLVIKTGVPKPARRRFSRAGESKYTPLFAALKPGQSVDVPAQYQATLYTAAKKLNKTGPARYTVQRTGIDTCTVWRDA